jgi:hypothetical protein
MCGRQPVVMIYAREISDPLTSLVKKINQAAIAHQQHRLGSFVVFRSDDETLKDRLKTLAREKEIRQTILAVEDTKNTPHKCRLAGEAEVTVVLYTKFTVKANYAFRKGELTETAVRQVLSGLTQILPGK